MKMVRYFKNVFFLQLLKTPQEENCVSYGIVRSSLHLILFEMMHILHILELVYVNYFVHTS